MAADSTMLRTRKRFTALSLGTMEPDASQNTRLTCENRTGGIHEDEEREVSARGDVALSVSFCAAFFFFLERKSPNDEPRRRFPHAVRVGKKKCIPRSPFRPVFFCFFFSRTHPSARTPTPRVHTASCVLFGRLGVVCVPNRVVDLRVRARWRACYDRWLCASWAW